MTVALTSLCHQVLREVAVLDAMNRGACYSMRIRQLGPFSQARRCDSSEPTRTSSWHEL